MLALGKHGARELNYSSDVDLIVLYDAAAASIPEGVEPGPLFVRIAKALARLLQERTRDGYVLQGRPSPAARPGSTPVALSIASAYAYYETLGQNWERAAMIKARPVAGDLALGKRFLADLAPFIWRKYFDYAAIADIHAMKRQIHAVRGHERVAVPGHDVKLGRGGIREIEFFVQTQQLIFGGRRPQMRGARTLDMLRQLRADNWVSAEAVEELTEAYRLPAPHRAPLADGRGRADAAPAVRSAPRSRASPSSAAMRGLDVLRQRSDPSAAAGREALRAPVRGRADPRRGSRQPRLHRRRRRSRERWRPCAASASSGRRRRPRPSAAGISAAAPRSAARARARC